MSAPMPTGPPILCAAMLTASAWSTSSGMRPNACTASVWNRAPASCAARAILPTGCTTPVSLFALITLTSATSGPRSLRTASSVTTPPRLGRASSTSKPRPRSAGTTSSSLSCSMADTMTLVLLRSRSRAPSAMPYSARLLDSVPPEVNTTSPGLKPPPTQRAMSRRHCSSFA